MEFFGGEIIVNLWVYLSRCKIKHIKTQQDIPHTLALSMSYHMF